MSRTMSYTPSASIPDIVDVELPLMNPEATVSAINVFVTPASAPTLPVIWPSEAPVASAPVFERSGSCDDHFPIQ